MAYGAVMNTSSDEVGRNEQNAAPECRAEVQVARLRLRSSLSPDDALEAVREIGANLLGSEEVAVFKVDRRNAVLWLHWSCGVDTARYSILDVFCEPRLEEVLEGKTLLLSDSGERPLLSLGDPVSALVPVFLDGAVAAVIVLFRLLSHKLELDSADREVCEVLSSEAGRLLTPGRPNRQPR